MKRVACFSIPAHGHTNPMVPVAAELVRRGHAVRFYSFEVFREKIEAAGVEFVPCDGYLPPLSEKEQAGLMKVSTTGMTLQDIRVTLAMNDFLEAEFAEFKPDVVYSDAVCFWGKLNAWKHGVPLVVSTSTFAFNRLSSRYMKYSAGEMADMVLGLPKISRALKGLEPYGYKVKSALALVQNDNTTDSVVYTSRRVQPFAESFSDHYAFVGPSVFSRAVPDKGTGRPLVYIALGTVINDRPDFYRKCIEALRGMDAEAVIACGDAVDISALGPLPENVRVTPRVDQPEVLARASAFITHCGMNSASEGLYMAAPMLLYPQTGEQQAVARRVHELGAGRYLKDDSAEGIRAALEALLGDADCARAAAECSADLRSCPGPAGAADFIEAAPHAGSGVDPLKELDRRLAPWRWGYRLAVAAAVLGCRLALGSGCAWAVGIAAGVASQPVMNVMQGRVYRRMGWEK